MIDLGVSNNKLFERSVRLVAMFAGVSEQQATEALLKSIYKTDSLTEEIRKAPISRHIESAFGGHLVVPKALLLATGKFDLQSAAQRLSEQPVVRKVMQEIIG